VPESGTLWVGSIVIDCREFERMLAFWSAALGYVPREPPTDDWVVLVDPRIAGPNISLQKDPEGRGGTYWFHLDLYSSAPEEDVRRLLGLGATMVQPARAGFDYVTLADPEGNPFDVVDARGRRFGQRTD
jgi:catechol 2,3-dioxygenase-like lactoylglutathione lyase family enzyme